MAVTTLKQGYIRPNFIFALGLYTLVLSGQI